MPSNIEQIIIILDHFRLQFLYTREIIPDPVIENKFSLWRTAYDNPEAISFLAQKYEELITKISEPMLQKIIKLKLLKLYLFSNNSIESDKLVNELALLEPEVQKYKEEISMHTDISMEDKFNLLDSMFPEAKITAAQYIEMSKATPEVALESELHSISLIDQKAIDDKNADEPEIEEDLFVSFLMNSEIISGINIRDCTYIEDKDYLVYCSQEILDKIENPNLIKKFRNQLDEPHFAEAAYDKNGIKYLGDDVYEIKLSRENGRIFGFLTKATVFLPHTEEVVEIRLLYFNEYKSNGHTPHAITKKLGYNSISSSN